MLDPEDYSTLLRLRCDVAFIRLQIKLLRLHLALRYDENQPRAPAGTPIGGQWIDGGGSGGGSSTARARIGQARTSAQGDAARDALQEGLHAEGWRAIGQDHRPDGSLARELVAGPDGSRIYSEYAPAGGDDAWDTRHLIEGADGNILIVENAGDTQTLFDGRGQAISQSVWGKYGPEAVPLVQPAFLPAFAVPAVTATVELGLTLFTWMATRNVLNGGGQPVIAFNAREYTKDNPSELTLNYVGSPSKDKIKEICERWDDVQTYTNLAAAATTGINKYTDPARYGTEVHKKLKDLVYIDPIKAENYNINKIYPEISFLKSASEGISKYGKKDTVRIDVLENAKNDMVCVYDIKTGKSDLSASRMAEIAENSRKFNNNVKSIIVIEVRQNDNN